MEFQSMTLLVQKVTKTVSKKVTEDPLKLTKQVSAIVHDGAIVISNLEVIASTCPLITLVEVMHPVCWNVVPMDFDILVPVSSRVLMEKPCPKSSSYELACTYNCSNDTA